ncbi:MAG: DUF6876 family protein [Terracidiphilus sp.]
MNYHDFAYGAGIKRIEFTDFPLDSITLYCENGTILLPSEH